MVLVWKLKPDVVSPMLRGDKKEFIDYPLIRSFVMDLGPVCQFASRRSCFE